MCGPASLVLENLVLRLSPFPGLTLLLEANKKQRKPHSALQTQEHRDSSRGLHGHRHFPSMPAAHGARTLSSELKHPGHTALGLTPLHAHRPHSTHAACGVVWVNAGRATGDRDALTRRGSAERAAERMQRCTQPARVTARGGRRPHRKRGRRAGRPLRVPLRPAHRGGT